MVKKYKLPKNVNEAYLHQLHILQALSPVEGDSAPPTRQMHEICDLSGLRDEKEVQRFLFILEGQKLVSPQPPGDFTSKNWQITREGLRVLRNLDRTLAAA